MSDEGMQATTPAAPGLGAILTCPVCAARFRNSVTCSRCGTDLRPLMRIAARAWRCAPTMSRGLVRWRSRSSRAPVTGSDAVARMESVAGMPESLAVNSFPHAGPCVSNQRQFHRPTDGSRSVLLVRAGQSSSEKEQVSSGVMPRRNKQRASHTRASGDACSYESACALGRCGLPAYVRECLWRFCGVPEPRLWLLRMRAHGLQPAETSIFSKEPHKRSGRGQRLRESRPLRFKPTAMRPPAKRNWSRA